MENQETDEGGPSAKGIKRKAEDCEEASQEKYLKVDVDSAGQEEKKDCNDPPEAKHPSHDSQKNGDKEPNGVANTQEVEKQPEIENVPENPFLRLSSTSTGIDVAPMQSESSGSRKSLRLKKLKEKSQPLNLLQRSEMQKETWDTWQSLIAKGSSLRNNSLNMNRYSQEATKINFNQLTVQQSRKKAKKMRQEMRRNQKSESFANQMPHHQTPNSTQKPLENQKQDDAGNEKISEEEPPEKLKQDDTGIDFFFMSLTQQVKRSNLSAREFISLQVSILDALDTKISKTKNSPQPEEAIKYILPELTPQQHSLIESVTNSQESPTEMIITKYNLKIVREELCALLSDTKLSDNVINFYMNLIVDRSSRVESGVESLPHVFTMNTLFYGRLLNAGYMGVKKWAKKIDFLTYDIILVPILAREFHWSLAIINMRNRSIRYYDSLAEANMRVVHELELFLRKDLLEKQLTLDITGWRKECVEDLPRQVVESDSGVLCCTFAEYISRGSNITFRQEDFPYFRSKMIVEIATGTLLL